MDTETGETLRCWTVCITILLVLLAFIGAVVYHLGNPNLYKVCTDGCEKIYDNSGSLRAECFNKCNQYVGDALNKMITILNSTVEKIDWNK